MNVRPLALMSCAEEERLLHTRKEKNYGSKFNQKIGDRPPF